MLDLVAANIDPEVFGSDATRFDPHRELSDSARPAGVAFGGGPHMCIGRSMAAGFRAGATDAPSGMLPQLLRGLVAAGVRLDPTNPPVLRQDTLRANFDIFPIVFEPTASSI